MPTDQIILSCKFKLTAIIFLGKKSWSQFTGQFSSLLYQHRSNFGGLLFSSLHSSFAQKPAMKSLNMRIIFLCLWAEMQEAVSHLRAEVRSVVWSCFSAFICVSPLWSSPPALQSGAVLAVWNAGVSDLLLRWMMVSWLCPVKRLVDPAAAICRRSFSSFDFPELNNVGQWPI